MNKFTLTDDGHSRLPNHAHIIVYERPDEEQLLTIYKCGAAQKPPAAQLIGHLVRVDADCELIDQPNGYIVKLRERATLEEQAGSHWVIRGTDDTQ